MCSLIGASSPKKLNEFDVKLLFLYGESRGGDACGYFDGDYILRNTVDAYEFAEDLEVDTNYFIGHTRKSSVGKNTTKNAHPFDVIGIVGAHNGTINNHYKLSKKYGIKYDVDSELIFKLIKQIGLEQTLPQLQGSLALQWVEVETDIVYLYRYNNPLYIGKMDGGLYWGSEKPYLEGIGCQDIYLLEAHTLYAVKDGEITSRKLTCKQPTSYYNPISDMYGNAYSGYSKPPNRRGETYDVYSKRWRTIEGYDKNGLGTFIKAMVVYETYQDFVDRKPIDETPFDELDSSVEFTRKCSDPDILRAVNKYGIPTLSKFYSVGITKVIFFWPSNFAGKYDSLESGIMVYEIDFTEAGDAYHCQRTYFAQDKLVTNLKQKYEPVYDEVV